MNYIDAILILIMLLSLWTGVQKGFILGAIELFCWLVGLVFSFWAYPFLVSFLEKYFPSAGIWTVPLAFLITLIVIRIALAFLAERFLKAIPQHIHTKQVNKISGALPGLLSGVVYAALAALLLILLPLSPGLTKEAKESKVAGTLTANLEKVEAKFASVLDNVNRSISKVTIKPGSNKFIKLGFTVKDSKRRTDLEEKMLLMVNEERRIAGLNALKADPEIAEVALKHSKDMFERGYFSHISPEGATPFDRIRKDKISFLAAGENLALAQTLAVAHKGLMNSPGHKANILHRSFGRLGIGILDAGIYGIMVTQNFRN
ncbi:MAG: CvpA family protein [Pyrinomonadaceae bacterium]|nr:CvpA family protein [Sphingobacteriaceae bacterium]